MVSTDLREAGARYLRTIWHTTESDDRPGALCEAWDQDLPYGCQPESFDELREALAADMLDLDAFWPRWIDELRNVEGDRLMCRLRTQAVLDSEGVDGLSALAREPGARQAEHCLAWVDALAGAERTTDAVTAAIESLAIVADDGPGRGRIADRLADLPGCPDVPDARREAWRAEPSSLRLRALYEAAPDPVAVVALEAARPLDLTRRLEVELLLLAGEVDRAILLSADETLEVLPVLLPYLLVAGSGAVNELDWTESKLSVLFGGMDRIWGGAVPEAPPARLPDLLERALMGAEPHPEWLDIAAIQIDRLINRIVTGKQQREYGWAATVAVCYAEALTWSGGDGAALARSVFAAYPRHRSFKAALQAAVVGSPKIAAATGPAR
jgi:hypothetical protein